ncbi:hypothetical protein E3N88_09743 [Mikania micrantha]|uniref:Uncharacterized protein n=1 Tax=Mikania micrantha TaxID=192012 RepID=A0A5N6PKT8_9ASTR|nr:hypothetical protein E3N88_09743 [Mikania micrantha]
MEKTIISLATLYVSTIKNESNINTTLQVFSIDDAYIRSQLARWRLGQSDRRRQAADGRRQEGGAVDGRRQAATMAHGMKRWMTERMAASAGMDVPVFPRPGHHQDPAPQEQDPGGHA